MRQRRAAVAAIATIAAAAALMLLMSACGDDGGSASSDVRVDTVGGIIRLTNTGPGAWGPDEAWRLGDEVRIGADPAAEEAFAFGDITGLTVAADGRSCSGSGGRAKDRASSGRSMRLRERPKATSSPGIRVCSASPGSQLTAAT
jgi:hypothetical protein